MRNHNRFLQIITVVAGMLLIATVLCACTSSKYKPVTFTELTGNSTAYNGQNVSITGIYEGQFPDRACPAVLCTIKCNCSFETVESYLPFEESHLYQIKDGNITIAFEPPPDKDGYASPPNFETGESITVKGEVVTMLTVPFACCACHCKYYRSLLIDAASISYSD